jgi:hypothetical protein
MSAKCRGPCEVVFISERAGVALREFGGAHYFIQGIH